MTAIEVASGIRRVLAGNPGMMTGPGTNTYLIGEREVAIVDAGPALPAHLDAVEAVAGGRIQQLWLTHAHPDHAGGVPKLRARTGAQLSAWPVPNPTYPIPGLFSPECRLQDGDALSIDGQAWQALHTPGHASDHVCFWRPSDGVLLTGDVVVGLGTVVIAPPDGDLTAYLQSLERLAALKPARLLPGHGDPIEDAGAKLSEYLAHRLAREVQVVEGLATGASTIEALVAAIYPAIAAPVRPVAAQQVYGHLLKLEREGRVRRAGDGWERA